MKKNDKSELIEKGDIGIFWRDHSGRLCYEIGNLPSDAYSAKKKEIVKKFGLIPFGITIAGLDEIFKTYIKGFSRIGIEWDIWSGLIIVAKNKRAESLIWDIGRYFEEKGEI